MAGIKNLSNKTKFSSNCLQLKANSHLLLDCVFLCVLLPKLSNSSKTSLWPAGRQRIQVNRTSPYTTKHKELHGRTFHCQVFGISSPGINHSDPGCSVLQQQPHSGSLTGPACTHQRRPEERVLQGGDSPECYTDTRVKHLLK